MNAPARELATLVARAQAGDRNAFDAIYERFADALFRYIYARCGNPTMAEELMGDLWVRVVERLGKFQFPPGEPDAAFAAWLYRIAHNLVIDAYRRRGDLSMPLLENIAVQDQSPDELAIMSDEKRELHEALQLLTPDQREVLLLRFFEEMSHAEVARQMGRTEGAVKVMQHRALGALARLLGGERRGSRG